MRRTTLLTAAFLLLLAASALAAGSAKKAPDAPEQAAPQQSQQPQAQPGDQPPLMPMYMDQVLAREHERFSQFALEQMRRMNANIIGGKHAMQVKKQHDGRYHASYKAIDVEGIVCQVRRSESNPNYYVGSVIYKELILESVAKDPEACRKGEFVRVSEKSNRIIYSSKNGGGWQ